MAPINPVRKTSSGRGSQNKEAAPLSLDYDQISRLCLKYWKQLVGVVVAGILAGLIFAAFQTSIYEAKATILVPATSPNVPSVGSVAQTDDTTGDMIKTYVQLLQTKALPEMVVKSEHLNENSEFLPNGVTAVSEEEATGMLAGEISIRIPPFTRLIEISVQHRSPKMAQLLANKLAEASIEQEFTQKSAGASAAVHYLQNEVDRLRPKVAESERALREYQSTHNLSGSSDTPEDAVDTRLKQLNQQYINAEAQVTLLKERYLPEHPKLIQATAEVEELRNELNKAQAESVTSSGKNSEYSTLKSEAESCRAQLENTLKDLHATETAVYVAIPGMRVSDEASLPYAPVSPNKIKTAAAGGFIGLVCGLGFIMSLYFMDSSLRTVSQTESTLNVSVIGAVPILRESDGSSVLPTFSDPQSFVAESFRGIRASLILYDREHPLKTILMASAIPGEGKSFCAANLAVAFAQAGLKTLLIDADLRLPTLHTYFNLPLNEEYSGFPDILAGRKTLASAVVPSSIPNLTLLLTTTPVDAPAELLSGIRLPLLLDETAQKYDRIVIDTAPLNAVSDTMLIMQKADAILLVIRAAQTPASECRATLQKIESNKMKPLGLILNYIDPHTLRYYSYGYSYGQKPKEKNAT